MDLITIAIADDHSMFRKGLIMLINLLEGYKVVYEAANGREMTDHLQSGAATPDIVLLDINMPQLDGYATAAWISKHFPQVKILALSTIDTEAAIIRMIRNGSRGYILKDAEPTDLQLAFREVLSTGYYYNDQLTRRLVMSINALANEKSELSKLLRLTDREQEFIRLCCSEKSYQQIAGEMFLSERTIDGYRENLFKKFNVSTRVGLVIYAIKNGIVKL
jgi:DNA-binding NarL/FixJ family response regulator